MVTRFVEGSVPRNLASSDSTQRSKVASKARSPEVRTPKTKVQQILAAARNQTGPNTSKSARPTSLHFGPTDASSDLTSTVHDIGVESKSNSAATSTRLQSNADTRPLNMFFDDDEELPPPSSPQSDESIKGKKRKEPWDENIARQERYHNEMMEIQRESLDVFKGLMSQMIDCFRRN